MGTCEDLTLQIRDLQRQLDSLQGQFISPEVLAEMDAISAEISSLAQQQQDLGCFGPPPPPPQTKRQPWAVLVCRFSDDKDPAEVLVKDLPQINNPDPTQTALDLFKMFFTKQGNNTFNAVRYFNEMSHGSIDLNDSAVYVVNLNMTKAEGTLPDNATPAEGEAYRVRMTQAAQTAAVQQGVPLQLFYGIVVTSHYFLSMAQGGPIPGGAIVAGPQGWAGMDYRWVKNNGIQSWGQEMGHGFGLDHSRSEGIPIGPDGVTPDYTDKLDVMSTRNADSGPDPDYGFRGPGINAWNMRGRTWLDETRVWHCPHGSFDQALQLRPLHRKDLAGFLAAELPPLNDTDGFPRYLVEYRKQENWDNGIPGSCISVHSFEGKVGQFLGTHSYVMKGTQGQYSLVPGDRFAPSGAMGPQLSVMGIDDNASAATVRLTFPNVAPGAMWHTAQPTPASAFGEWSSLGDARGLGRTVVGSNADGRLEVFTLDSAGKVWHTVQDAPNGSFGDWSQLGGGAGLGEIAVISTASGSLEVFATDTAAGLAWTIFQDGPNGNWEGWVRVGDGVGLRQIAVGRNADGRLEVFALDSAAKVWHTVQPTPREAFGSWSQLGGGAGLGEIAVISTASGSLEVFATDTAAGLAWTIFQDGPNGNWEGWVNIGGVSGLHQIAAGRNADGRLEVFTVLR